MPPTSEDNRHMMRDNTEDGRDSFLFTSNDLRYSRDLLFQAHPHVLSHAQRTIRPDVHMPPQFPSRIMAWHQQFPSGARFHDPHPAAAPPPLRPSAASPVTEPDMADVLEAARACLDLSKPSGKRGAERTATPPLPPPPPPQRVVSDPAQSWSNDAAWDRAEEAKHVVAPGPEGANGTPPAPTSSALPRGVNKEGNSTAENTEAKGKKRKKKPATAEGSNAGGTGGKPKKRWKKEEGAPRRPLSAYNIFFSEERARILAELPEPEDDGGKGKGGDRDAAGSASDHLQQFQDSAESPTDSQDVPDSQGGDGSGQPNIAWARSTVVPSKAPSKRRAHRKTHGKIGFKDLAKTIGRRWKELPDDRMQRYKQMAKTDTLRYQQDMAKYKGCKAGNGGRSPESTGPVVVQ